MPRNNLDKDIRLIQVEAFHNKLFGRESHGKNGLTLKVEIAKLHSSSREVIMMGSENSGL
jgi:hypothetical protein